MIELAELYEKGLAPMAGGVLDQAKIFVQGVRFIWGEQRHWRAKLGILGYA